MPVISIPEFGDKFQDYRDEILGDSYNWGPTINPANIKYFTFHHSVTKQTAKVDHNWKKECDVIAGLHVNGNGWGGIGYRFVICSDGTVAYVGDLSHGGSAVGNNNEKMFSACFVGDFTKELPTAAQVHSAHILAKFFLTQMPAYPNLNNWGQVIGHQDAFNTLHLPGAEPTACPGSNWKVAGDNLYTRIVNDKFQGYPDPQPQGTIPVPTPPPPPPSNQAEIEALKKQVEELKVQMTGYKTQLDAANDKLNKLKAILN